MKLSCITYNAPEWVSEWLTQSVGSSRKAKRECSIYPKVCTENSHWLPVNWLHREPIQVLHFGDAFPLDSGPWRNQCEREQVGRLKISIISKHRQINNPNRTRHYYTTNGLPLTSLLQYGSTNLGLLGYQASSEKINRWLILLGLIGQPLSVLCLREMAHTPCTQTILNKSLQTRTPNHLLSRYCPFLL